MGNGEWGVGSGEEDKGTRRRGDKGRSGRGKYLMPSPCLLVPLSPCLHSPLPTPHSLLTIFRNELDGGEADHRPLVDIPLIVAQHVALNVLDVPHRTQESVKRLEPAPFQTILSGFDHLEKLVAVAIADALQTLLIFLSHFQHLVLIGAGDQIVARCCSVVTTS